MVNGIRLDDQQSVSNLYNDMKTQVRQSEDGAAVRSVPGNGEAAAGTQEAPEGGALAGGVNAAVAQALEEAGLPRNERNTGIVRQMLENQMSIDKDSISRILTQANVFREADLSTLLLMNKNNIPVTHFTAAQLQAYINNEQDLSAQIGTTLNGLMEFLDSEASAGNVSANMGVLEMLTTQSEVTSENMAALGNADNAVAAETLNTNAETVLNTVLTGQGGGEAVTASVAQQSAVVPDDMAIRNMMETSTVSNIVAELGTEAEGSGANWMNGFGSDESDVNSFNEFNMDKGGTGLNNKAQDTAGQQGAPLSSMLNENEIKDLNDLHQRVFGSKGNFDGNQSAAEVLKELYQNAGQIDEAKLNELFRSGTYQKLVRSALNEKFTLNPEDIDSPDSINNFYKDAFSSLSKLSELAEKDQALAEKFAKPMDNIKFMDTLNNVFPYIQLPLKLNEGKAHGELYVFKKGRTKSDPSESKSVLLHLDMDNLGPTDIHMELKSSALKLRFYCADDVSCNLLSENFKGLEDALNNKGFNVASDFTVRETETKNIVEALSGGTENVPEFKYGFDIRA